MVRRWYKEVVVQLTPPCKPCKYRKETNQSHTMQIKPLHDYIAIDRDPEESTTTTGIVLIHTRNVGKGCFTGTVVACGEGVEIDGKHDEIVVNPGDRVAYSKNTGVVHKINGKEFLFVKQRDLMGIVRD